MPPSRAMRVKHKAESVVASLRNSGVSFLPNDEDAYAVFEEVMRTLRGTDLKVETPRFGFGGEYVFRSENRLSGEGFDR